jgi:hypothetical protein
MQISKVYAVIGGWDYEGENFDSMRLFDCYSTAEKYQNQLTNDEGYDYALLKIREVIQESLFSEQVEKNLEALCQRMGC